MNRIKQVFFNLFLFTLFFSICLILSIYTEKNTYASNAAAWQLHIASLRNFLNISATQFASLFKLSDFASYVNAAQYFLQNGYFEKEMIAMWPPGFSTVIALTLKFTGENSYPFKMLIVNMVAWSCAFFFMYHALITVKNSIVKILLAIMPIYFETFRIWIFGLGPFLSESISLPLFIIAIGFFIRWLQTERVRDLAWMGAFLAMSAYFRGYVELFGNFLVLVVLFFLLLKIVKYITIQKLSTSQLSMYTISKQLYLNRQKFFDQRTKAVLLAILTFILLLLPWRIYMHKVFGSFSWQQLSSIIWSILWYPGKLQMFLDANLACQVQPSLCKILAQNIQLGIPIDTKVYELLALVAVISHPVAWFSEKVKFFNGLWFGTFGVIPWRVLITQYTWLFFEGCLIFLIGLTVTLASGFLWLRYSIEKMNLLFWFSLFFIIFNIIVFTFFHYEARYSLFIRIYFVYSIVAFGIILHQHKIKTATRAINSN